MATGKYTRIDNNRRSSSSSYCSTVTVVVFVVLCLAGVWMITKSSVVLKGDYVPQGKKHELKEHGGESKKRNTPQFEDNPGDLPEDANKEASVNSNAEQNRGKSQEKSSDGGNKSDDGSTDETGDGEKKSEDSDSETDKTDNGGGVNAGEEGDSEEGTTDKKSFSDISDKKSDADSSERKSDSDDTEKKSDSDESEKKPDSDDSEKKSDSDGGEKKLDDDSGEKNGNSRGKNQSSNEEFPSGAQSELLNETTTQTGSFSTQAAESKNEKEAQKSFKSKTSFNWKLCNVTAGPDFIPCLDNLNAIKHLHSTKHYEHRERHCPEEPPTCLVSLPEGYKRSITWPKSREKIWYSNVPHIKLAQVKGHQNWVKVTGEYLTFPGGGTQFKHGALHYIDFIQESVSNVAWGKHSRVVLDVGCGVASFGGYLFDRDVLTMSLAPKDEHEAQVQFALERGIPAISAVMGTKRLPFPARVFDVVHCARCRVPWHIEGGKLLLELNRLLRPGGFFIWSATPVYQKLPEDVEIWEAMKKLTKHLCWENIKIIKDTVNRVGIAIYKKPTSNECYEKRSQSEPPLCKSSDDPNAAWNVPLEACLHKAPVDTKERGSQWPEQWPARVSNTPYWLLSSQTGVYGKPAPEDFAADFEHWRHVVNNSYLNGMGIDWSSVRNVMDMRSIYGGFAAALKDLKIWVMNVVSIDSADTLPVIYERGLFGIYHDWCESFSTYPRTYDLLHADHLFSRIKKRCNIVALVAEVDRILRPEGKLIVRDDAETINELESMVKSMHWEVRLTFSKNNEGLLCVQKSMWRPNEQETLTYAIA